VSVMIRDDLDVSPRKLTAVAGEAVSLLSAELIAGIFEREPGRLNPWDAIKHSDIALFDESVAHLSSFTIAVGEELCVGAQWDGYAGLPSITPTGRDLHSAAPGLRCGRCQVGLLEGVEAVELAHVFELGHQYSTKMGLHFADADGAAGTPYMACSGLGVTRCMQAIAGKFRDGSGLRWPVGIGPADVHIVGLRADQPEIRERVAKVATMFAREARVLVDDRATVAGEKFAFASSLGVPYQVVISPRQAPTEVELINRWTGRRGLTELTRAIAEVTARGNQVLLR
jgi:prolyl-tRNA synthetase